MSVLVGMSSLQFCLKRQTCLNALFYKLLTDRLFSTQELCQLFVQKVLSSVSKSICNLILWIEFDRPEVSIFEEKAIKYEGLVQQLLDYKQ